ncbi:hypothetical protein SCOCK_200026 [Actinacidiphila cocklensis]|uniref:Uncharacterized protein n=1 Tax=Actinacidiphila cocklensis TaxID=887465 RepID=A0A9W4E517_9ACTN|nr:hypothetical protein SCOCK_200026 [Actinacidiphila cocklensis]
MSVRPRGGVPNDGGVVGAWQLPRLYDPAACSRRRIHPHVLTRPARAEAYGRRTARTDRRAPHTHSFG